MKRKNILLTGANGYIGMRLLPALLAKGHHVFCAVRDKNRFDYPAEFENQISVLEIDFLDRSSLERIPKDISAAYYLIHSMSSSQNFEDFEKECAQNFTDFLSETNCEHVVYLSGMANDDTLSRHLSSRKAVEDVLSSGSYHFTALRAGIIIGSGSGSYEIIRDLVEKLPVMITPKWLNTKCQPIGIYDVILFLEKVLFYQPAYDKDFDIGGPEVLTYKQMLLRYAEVRGLKRWIFTVPVMTPKLSSYWLYFITSTSYRLAIALVDSMKVEVVCRDQQLAQMLSITPKTYQEALERTLRKIENHDVISSWKDSFVSSQIGTDISAFLKVPSYGCFIDRRKVDFQNRMETLERVWMLGGETGWYYGDWMWRLRGYLDKLFGGVGLRRGRTHLQHLSVGDVVDFWRVLYANKEEGRLLLFAEMKLPGEAWLEFKLEGSQLVQTATFRPKGVWGRLYWYSVLPFHGFVFQGMANALAGVKA